MVPSVGSSRVAIMRMRVVLPAPLGPTNPTMPGSQRSDSPRTAQRCSYCLPNRSIVNSILRVSLSVFSVACVLRYQYRTGPSDLVECCAGALEGQGGDQHQHQAESGQQQMGRKPAGEIGHLVLNG